MPQRKRRSFQQIMEEQSLACIREVLPAEWVIHEYKPDYGIDFIVEVFNYVDEKRQVAETLGEVFFVQAKSIQTSEIVEVDVYGRKNVEKSDELQEQKDEYIRISVIKFVIETSELLTIQAMGAATPVILLLVTLDTKKVYQLCLNDYIDKVLIPSDPNYEQKDRKTIYVPVKNEVLLSDIGLHALRFYARRAKMYAAFSKFGYQYHELGNPIVDSMQALNIQNMLSRFFRTALQQDIWHTTEWEPVKKSLNELKRLQDGLKRWQENDDFADIPTFLYYSRICWYRLDNLSRMYEELCREWFLPTFLAQMLSYPDYPEIRKTPPS